MGSKARTAAKEKNAEAAMTATIPAAPPARARNRKLPCDPRLFWLVCLCIAGAVHFWWGNVPLPFLPGDDTLMGRYKAILAMPFAALSLVAHEGAMSLVKQGLLPAGFNLQPPGKLVTGGLLTFTRHPIYMAMVSINLALSIGFNSSFYCNALLPTLAYFQYCIGREELALEVAFGDQYIRYKAKVPKWMGPFR